MFLFVFGDSFFLWDYIKKKEPIIRDNFQSNEEKYVVEDVKYDGHFEYTQHMDDLCKGIMLVQTDRDILKEVNKSTVFKYMYYRTELERISKFIKKAIYFYEKADENINNDEIQYMIKLCKKETFKLQAYSNQIKDPKVCLFASLYSLI